MKPRVGVVGQVTLDEIVLHDRAQDELPSWQLRIRLGGKAFNIAMAAARLECEPSIYSAVGTDNIGDKAREVLTDAGVNTGFLRSTLAGGLSVQTPRVRLTEGVSQARWVELFVDQKIVSDYERAALTLPDATHDAVVVSLEWAEEVASVLARALDSTSASPRKPLMVALASGWREGTPDGASIGLLERADVIVANRDEAAYWSTAEPGSSSLSLAQALRKRFDAESAVVTAGESGWTWASKTALGEGCHRRVEIVDKVGASDVFVAALTRALLTGQSLEDACRFAGLAARVAVGRSGGAERFPTLAELV